jgi:tripartite ATP-independent transporter DctP family solute receptor
MTGDRKISRRVFCQQTALMAGMLGAAPLLAGATFKPVVIKTAHLNTTDHPVHLRAVRFKELVEAATGGTVKVEIFPAGQMGPNENEQMQGVRLGTLQMCELGAPGMGVFVPDYQAMAVPYIWRDMEHLRKVTRGEIGAALSRQAIEKIGVRVLDGAGLYGDRHLTTKSKIIRTPDDLKGVKIRVPEAPMYLETIRSMGASTVAVATAEIYTALATGVADGQENPAVSILTWKLYEVQKYLMLTGHMTQNNVFVINENFWKSLEPGLQDIVQKAAWDSGDYETEQALQKNRQALDDLKAKGMEIHQVDLEAFKKVTSVVPLKFADKWTPGLVDKIRAVR